MDIFFCLFVRVAESRCWPAEEQTLLQCVIMGKTQAAYSAMSPDDCRDYVAVKSAVLRAYKLVPEAYRQRFRDQHKPGEGSNT